MRDLINIFIGGVVVEKVAAVGEGTLLFALSGAHSSHTLQST